MSLTVAPESSTLAPDFGRLIRKSEALRLLSDLVAIDSVNPDLVPGGAGERGIAEHIASLLTGWGMEAEVVSLGGTRANVVGRLRGRGAGSAGHANGGSDSSGGSGSPAPIRTLMLNGHLDTVGVQGMPGDPFRAKVEGDRVYGRGSGDMKAGLTSILLAMKALKEAASAGFPLDGDVLFTGVADEEYKSIGTEDAARRYRADGAVICESTGGMVGVTHMGFAWIDVEVHGKAAHGSDPEGGMDAIVNAGKFLVAMDRFEKNALFRRRHPLIGPASIHASLISGGKELSTYPDYCKISLERRTIPGETEAAVKAEIDGIIASLQVADPGFRAGAEVTFFRPELEVPADAPIVRALGRAIRSVTGADARLVGGRGWTDCAILQAAGIPAVLFGPEGGGAHSLVEYADVPSTLETAQVLCRLAWDFCGETT